MGKRVSFVVVILLLILAQMSAQAAIVADSQASFIGIQGEGGWNWMVWDGVGEYTTSSASLCPFWADWGGPDWNGGWYNSDWFGIHIQGYLNQLGQSNGHDNWGITRWTSSVAAPVTISITLGTNTVNDAGKGHLWINGTEVWSQVIPQDAVGHTYTYDTNLAEGDLVDFGTDSQGLAISNISPVKYVVDAHFGSISGTITLADFAGDKTLAPVRINLLAPGTATVKQTKTVILDETGAYLVEKVIPGSYDVTFSACTWLRKMVNTTIDPDTNVGIDAVLVAGDVDGDNEITSTDLSILGLGLGIAGD